MVLKKAIQLLRNGLLLKLAESGPPTSDGLILPNPPMRRIIRNNINHPNAKICKEKRTIRVNRMSEACQSTGDVSKLLTLSLLTVLNLAFCRLLRLSLIIIKPKPTP